MSDPARLCPARQFQTRVHQEDIARPNRRGSRARCRPPGAVRRRGCGYQDRPHRLRRARHRRSARCSRGGNEGDLPGRGLSHRRRGRGQPRRAREHQRRRARRPLSRSPRARARRAGEGGHRHPARRGRSPASRPTSSCSRFPRSTTSSWPRRRTSGRSTLMAAIEAGKHVFMEKPCAVDVPGVRLVMEAGELATQKKLGIAAGTQRRHDRGYRETIKRIQRRRHRRDRLREGLLERRADLGRSTASPAGATWSGSSATGTTSPGSPAITSSSSTCTTSTS